MAQSDNVVLYTKPGCVQCNATKRALNKRGLAFVEIDVSQDAEAFDQIQADGYMSVPVVKVVTDDGEVADEWAGFIPDKVEAIR